MTYRGGKARLCGIVTAVVFLARSLASVATLNEAVVAHQIQDLEHCDEGGSQQQPHQPSNLTCNNKHKMSVIYMYVYVLTQFDS